MLEALGAMNELFEQIKWVDKFRGYATLVKSIKTTIPFSIYSMTFSPWYFLHRSLLLLVLDLIM